MVEDAPIALLAAGDPTTPEVDAAVPLASALGLTCNADVPNTVVPCPETALSPDDCAP